MAGEVIITVVGNLVSDPELRYTQSGVAVANFTIASNPRVWDKTTNDWKEADALFLRCSVWRDYGEHVAASLKKGTTVIAQGRLKQRDYEDNNGNKRTSIEMDVEEIGPTLRFATAQVQRNSSSKTQATNQDAAWRQAQDEEIAPPLATQAQWDDETPF